MNNSPMRTLGRSGLVVSPLALGTMTFGREGWGSSDEVSRAIFDAYVDAGGTFIDTADVYADGRSEELVGAYVADRKLRDKLTIATKFSFHDGDDGDVYFGGNGRKNMQRALDGSLRRLRTDCIDLYWMHVWDRVTPVEEMVASFGDLVRAGKIRYFGFSDVPAWYAAKGATLAAAHALPGPIAMQLEYSLIERSIEREHVPAARECGLGICAWSPLAFGFLTGKYRRDGSGAGGRLDALKDHAQAALSSDRNWRTLDALLGVAAQLDRTPAQVALAWAAAQPGVTSLILGASTVEQLRDNLGSIDVQMPPEQRATLDTASALDAVHPYAIFTDDGNRRIFGGKRVEGWPS